MRSPIASALRNIADKTRSMDRAKTPLKSFISDFLGADAALAQNVAGQQIEWNREFLKACPAISAAITPLHFGLMNFIVRPLMPKDRPATPSVDIDTLAAVFGTGGGAPGVGAGLAGRGAR